METTDSKRGKGGPKRGGRGGSQHEDKKEEMVYQKKSQDQKQVAKREAGFEGSIVDIFQEFDTEYTASIIEGIEHKEHDYYFGSYSHFYIHEEMLKDRTRTLAYRNAIMHNADSFKDKIVLDIGAGTGILSIFAARAGAKHVYAVENAEIAHFAKEIVRKNGLSDKITIIKGKMEEVELPVETVDIIISEWMGYFLLYESMLDSVLWARDKYLNKKTGKMLPDTAKIFIAGIEDAQYRIQKTEFWEDQYGVDMSCLAHAAMKEPLIDYCDSQYINSSDSQILDLDLVHCDKGDVEFVSEYCLEFFRNDVCHAIVAWFDTDFADFSKPITLTTSPYAKSTHWKQTVFYLDEEIRVRKGDKLSGTIAVRKSKTNFRELDVKISYHFKNQHDTKNFTQLYKVR